ncbi:hypothetical protein K431DRAFT_294121 [Polychaeton citri CBS 116435]|uniref:Uncharacterized protein n=1 Tax=Polychaeton citri CBS 116435 TaxID=1314669 RepID=A0A9P4UQ58_9PEZI|nr:hypothetical protein K431DRAFT_294121 [Polychaeton citri CBS 116435]
MRRMARIYKQSDTNLPSPHQRAHDDEASPLRIKRRASRATEPKEISDLELEAFDAELDTPTKYNGPTTGSKRSYMSKFNVSRTSSLSQKSDTSSKPLEKWWRPGIPLTQQFKAITLAWVNLMYLFVPAGFAVYCTRQNPATIFVISFMALFSTTNTLEFEVEETMKYFNDTPAALISFSFGYAISLPPL